MLLKGLVLHGGGPSTKNLPRDVSLSDGRKSGVVHSCHPPPGWEMRINVTPTAVRDKPPTDQEIKGVVGQLRNGCAAGAMGMKAEHLMGWLCGIKHEESENGVAEEGDCWRLFVRLMQAVWESGTVPTQMGWMIIVLLPKGGGNYCGIGLLDPM